MSRKSKRRRMRNTPGEPPAQRPETGDGFDFLDDRAAPAEVPLPVVESSPVMPMPAQRVKSVPARRQEPVLAGTESKPERTENHDARATASVGATATIVEDSPPAPPRPVPVPPPAEPTVTIGEILSTTREGRGLTIEEASSRTRIPGKMLEHLENDRFGEFAADAYARGFLRSYASFLGLDPQRLIVRYEALHGRPVESAPVDEVPAAEVVRRPTRRRSGGGRRTTVVTIAAGAVVLLAGAGFYLAHRGMLELRPAAGLQQIEDELRRTQDVPSSAAVPAAPGSGVVPESTAAADAAPTAGPTEATTPAAPGATQAPAVPERATEPQPIVRRDKPRTIAEDTSPKPLPPAFAPTNRRGVDTSRVTDLVEEVPPPAPPAASMPEPPSQKTETVSAPPPPPDDGRPLTLTATALDSCVLRVQVDANARAARRHVFTRRGETRSWVAKQSFRVLAQPSRNVELRLNGRLIPAPADGRTVVFDRATLQPARRPAATGRTTSVTPTP